MKTDQESVVVRKRNNDILPKIEMICDEEILETMRFVLEKQHGTMRKDLISTALRILGYKRVTQEIEKHVSRIITDGINNGVLEELGNGMVNLNHG